MCYLDKSNKTTILKKIPDKLKLNFKCYLNNSTVVTKFKTSVAKLLTIPFGPFLKYSIIL